MGSVRGRGGSGSGGGRTGPLSDSAGSGAATTDIAQGQMEDEEAEPEVSHVDSKVAAAAASMERVTIKQDAVVKKGSAGESIPLTANYIYLELLKEDKMFEYAVDFEPTVDSRDERFKLLRAQSETIGATRTFDGVFLFLPFLLKDLPTFLYGETSVDQSPVKITISLKHVKKMTDSKSVQFYNILFRRIMHRSVELNLITFVLSSLFCQAQDGGNEQEFLRSDLGSHGAAAQVGDLARLRDRSGGVRGWADAQSGRLSQGPQDSDCPRPGESSLP